MARSEFIQSWGRIGRPLHEIVAPSTIKEARNLIAEGLPWLAHGLGRSYGDVALNTGGRLIVSRNLNRFVAFDTSNGVIEAEAGVSIGEIIRIALPHGWFLPTTPGTMFVTLGGAVANDVHGKNHHSAGTFGCWVKSFELARSDGSIQRCSQVTASELFRATIGGLGLTGLITRVALQLVRIPSAYLDVEEIPYSTLDDFFALSEESDSNWEHTVAWMDCAGPRAGRGIFSRANWNNNADFSVHIAGPKITLPMDVPQILFNRFSIKIFNGLYYHLKSLRTGRTRQNFGKVFYPLDGIGSWNRLYGSPGFYQYQCVIPKAIQRQAMKELLFEIARSGQASFLAVIKTFGERISPGFLSFPMAGTNLALDFPNRGLTTLRLFERMDRIVAEAGGRIYPAKDGRMPAGMFRAGYPEWSKLAILKDPGIHSDFWSRVTV